MRIKVGVRTGQVMQVVSSTAEQFPRGREGVIEILQGCICPMNWRAVVLAPRGSAAALVRDLHGNCLMVYSMKFSDVES
jgi:hypothetical protein